MLKMQFRFRVYNINNESINPFSQLISVKVKKNLRKSQVQFQEKLKKLRLRQNGGFLIKKASSPALFNGNSTFDDKVMLELCEISNYVRFNNE